MIVGSMAEDGHVIWGWKKVLQELIGAIKNL